MRLAVILATIAAPALASDSAMFGGTGCKLTLTPDQPHVAEVRCRNVLEGGSPLNRATLTADWLTVDLIIHHQPGDIPDRFEVTPPDGYSAGAVDVQEGGEGVILVYPYLGF
jgi:RNA polymerase subunit RPABC4/transcription elongation factor Spt4